MAPDGDQTGALIERIAMLLQVKGWERFQHYKTRRPIWIKLYRDLLDNYEFMSLSVASKALAPLLWLLASESADGSIKGDAPRLAFRLRMPEKDVAAAVSELISKGFLIDASNSLAECLQDACLEKEKEKEKEKPLSGKPDFSHLKADAKEVLTFLNQKTGRAYKPVDANLNLIVARFREGYTAAEMRQVIAKKCREWAGDEKQSIYLRPETLFGKTKMAQYTGELVIAQEPSHA